MRRMWSALVLFLKDINEIRKRHRLWSIGFIFIWFFFAQLFQNIYGKFLLDPWTDPFVLAAREVVGAWVAQMIGSVLNLLAAIVLIGLPAALAAFVVRKHGRDQPTQAVVSDKPSASVASGTIPMTEAAKLAYGETRGTDFALGAEVRLGSENRDHGIITYYCYAIGDRIPIHGIAPPSPIPEVVNWRQRHLHFRFVGDELVLTDGYDGEIYKDLKVDVAEFETALAMIKTIAPGRPEERRKRKISEGLAVWVKAAFPLLDHLQDHDKPPPPELTKWNNDVAAYLLDNLGLQYETRFIEPQRFTDEQLGPLGRNPTNMARVGLEHKLKILHTIMDEHKT